MLLLCLQLTAAAPASAQQPQTGGKPNNAEQLFQEGVQDMRGGQYSVACPRLLASYQLDPLPGVLFTVAECEAGWAKLGTALGHYQEFVSALTAMTAERRETFEERRRIAAEQIAVLSVSAPTLTVDVAAASPPSMIVKFDGQLVPQSAYGVGRRVDPGLYAITAELDGKTVWSRNVTLEPGNQARVEVSMSPPAARANSNSSHQSATNEKHAAPRRTWTYVAGGVAVAGLTTGLVAGGLAYSHKHSIADNCPDLVCNSPGRRALDSARTEAKLSTGAFSVGLVGAAAVTLLLLLSPDSSPPNNSAAQRAHPRIGLASDGRSLSLTGGF
jgi:hypothetical protein